ADGMSTPRQSIASNLGIAILAWPLFIGCHHDTTATKPPTMAPRTVPPPAITATLASSRFHVADNMRAAIEMQLSGEPFAQLLGYTLAAFNRVTPNTDQYTAPGDTKPRTDPLGYALAVESYEYSKQPMNNLSFESGAGLSLMFGPVINSANASGDPAFQALLLRFQLFAAETQSGGPAGSNYIVSPAPTANPLNYYGWPG